MVTTNDTLLKIKKFIAFTFFSNILCSLTDRLSHNKQRKVYLPEDPFPHAQLVKDGRLRHFKALHNISELKQPSIIFCGHPSLRFGDVVHLVETFASNPMNTIIFTGRYDYDII